jgi:predicted DsbA family dithiol-disulfide isomerase
VSQPALTIDVVSDVVCPWCYLGKRRLERALATMPERAVTVRWRAFRLDPTIPPEGITRETYLTRKFGSVEAAADMYRRLTGIGSEEGIAYRFDRITRSPNTVDAHRLVRWAAAEGRQDAMVERLFAAYFTDGLDVGDDDVLARLAGKAGLDGDIAARLAGQEDRDAVTAEVEDAYRIGVSGVPCFILDQRYAVMGAQPAEVLADAIGQADAARAEAVSVTGSA